MSKFFYILSIILLIAKLFGLISISWLIVFLPVLLLWLINIVVFFTVLLIAIGVNATK